MLHFVADINSKINSGLKLSHFTNQICINNSTNSQDRNNIISISQDPTNPIRNNPDLTNIISNKEVSTRFNSSLHNSCLIRRFHSLRFRHLTHLESILVSLE